MTHDNPIDPILIVDNEKDFIDKVEDSLRKKAITNIRVDMDGNTLKSLRTIEKFSFILLNISIIPGSNGQQNALRILEDFPRIPVILLSMSKTYDDRMETALKYMDRGALYYYEKGELDYNELIEFICHGIRLYESIKPIITRDKKMRHVFREIGVIARKVKPVLLRGEAGVGKEYIAEAIHGMSGRNGNFVKIDITGFDDTLFTETLFGYVKGAFDDAKNERNGLIEEASEGTLFMDNIDDLHSDSQVKLLRLLRDGIYYKPGSNKEIKTDVRFIVAANKNIDDDFQYRSKCYSIKIPPLSERKEDIPLLVQFFIREALKENDLKKPVSADAEFIDILSKRDFKGNIEELRELIHNLVIRFSGCETLTPEMLEIGVNKGFNLEEEVQRVIQSAKEKLASLKMQTYKCLTVFFADLVGSTSGKTDYGHKNGMIRIHNHNTLAAEAIIRFNGKVIKYLGDGVLGVFEVSINAIKAAIAFSDALTVIENDIKLPMKSRITLTHGQVEELNLENMYDIGGQEVDKAARLQKEASPGQILADYQVIKNAKLDLQLNPFIKIKEITNKSGRKLKGLDEPVRIVEITT